MTKSKTLNSEMEGCEVVSLVEPLLPMEEEEEEIVVRNWIYKEENDDGPIFNVYDDDEEVYTLNQQDICDDLIPFTNLLWGDIHGSVNEASTSKI